MRYGLIPEFVGRLPVISILQVGGAAAAGSGCGIDAAPLSSCCCWAVACCRSLIRRLLLLLLQVLSEDELAHVLCEPRNALVKQYGGIFAKNGAK